MSSSHTMSSIVSNEQKGDSSGNQVDMSTMTSKHGLANVGNTCYLNSAFQALSRSPPFAKYFGTSEWTQHRHANRKGHDLAGNVAELVAELQSPGNKMIIPSKFVRSFIDFAKDINDEIRYGAQADAAEAIQILLDGLHTQQAREVLMDIKGDPVTPDQMELIKSLESWATFFRKEYSPLVEQFYGQTQTKVVCDGCKKCSTRYEPWAVLKVPIPGAEKVGVPAPNLKECIASAFATDTIDDYACESCNKKGPAHMFHTISRFPKHLILSLKRFTNTGAKVRARIPYDENCIDMNDWRAWIDIQGGQKYRVLNTVEHMGSSNGGHYIMRTREADKWYVYDDASISDSPIGGGAGPDTYILFLEQI